MKRGLRVLLVEDSPDIGELVKTRFLRQKEQQGLARLRLRQKPRS
jgi:hypothetical protein